MINKEVQEDYLLTISQNVLNLMISKSQIRIL